MNVPQCVVRVLLPTRVSNGQVVQVASPGARGYLPVEDAERAEKEGKVEIIARPAPAPPPPPVEEKVEEKVEEPPKKKPRRPRAKVESVFPEIYD